MLAFFKADSNMVYYELLGPGFDRIFTSIFFLELDMAVTLLGTMLGYFVSVR